MVTVGGILTYVRARVVSEAERSELVRQRPLWAAFQAHTDGVAPVVELQPV